MVKGVPVFDVNTISRRFLMMHSVVNGKDPIVKHGDEKNINNHHYLHHSVVGGSHSVSLMYELTLSDKISLNQVAERISQ